MRALILLPILLLLSACGSESSAKQQTCVEQALELYATTDARFIAFNMNCSKIWVNEMPRDAEEVTVIRF